MYAQIVSACEDWPWTMFRLFHSDGGEPAAITETHGAVLGGKQAIYMLGPFGGLEMSSIAISAASASHACFTGLQMDPDGYGVISASRLVFKETTAGSYQEAGIGAVSRAEAVDALGAELARSLRNEVDVFRPDVVPTDDTAHAPANSELRPLGRKALAELVNDRLNGSPSGMRLLRNGGRTFNPADESQLPFSTALEMLPRPYIRRERKSVAPPDER